jgi:hypothetical protein
LQPRINVTCSPGLNLSYRGFTTGGLTEMNFTVKDNGEKIVTIRKV